MRKVPSVAMTTSPPGSAGSSAVAVTRTEARTAATTEAGTGVSTFEGPEGGAGASRDARVEPEAGTTDRNTSARSGPRSIRPSGDTQASTSPDAVNAASSPFTSLSVAPSTTSTRRHKGAPVRPDRSERQGGASGSISSRRCHRPRSVRVDSRNSSSACRSSCKPWRATASSARACASTLATAAATVLGSSGGRGRAELSRSAPSCTHSDAHATIEAA